MISNYEKKNFKNFNILNGGEKLTNFSMGGGLFSTKNFLHEILTCQSIDKNEAITILQCFVYAYTIYMYVCRKKMPGNGQKSYSCCVCKRRTVPAERRNMRDCW